MKSKILNMMIIAIMVVGMIPTAAMAGTPADAPEAPAAQLSGPYVSPPVKPADTTGLPPAPTVDPLQDKVAREGHPARPMPKSLAATLPGFPNDSVVQTTVGNANMPAPLANFEGINNVDGVLPPDTNGEVGPNHYVQMVNISMAIYDKSGNLLYGPFHPSDLWPSGDVCNANNDGDPVVLYDQLADRWLVTQFALPNYPNGPYYECIAVSKTGTPTNDPNDWYPYTFLAHNTKMNDYPHLGVWPDGYYMSANQFTNGSSWGGAGAWVFDRAAMLTGAAATFQYFDVSSVSIDYGGMLPTDLDGMIPPPAGSPNYFVEVDDSSWIGPNDALRIWEFHVDWDNPANSTFGLAAPGDPNAILDTADFDLLPCVGSSRSCIPQPGTSQGLDSIGDRLMFRLAYRNFGDHESLVVNHTVWADGTDRAGIRWYEIRDPGGTPVIYQQGTYAPADGNYRWMGSIAMDHVGNMAMGYSVSSSTVYPSIRYTGRLAGDPLGTMPQAEAEIIAGSGYQSSSYARWGDYSDITVDPVDDCTFWFTTEYIETSGDRPWQTRIGSFKFPNCSLGPVGTLTGVVDDGTNGIPDALVVAEGITMTSQTTTDSNGVYTMTLPADSYTVTASAYGYMPSTVTGVDVLSGTVTTQNFTLATAPTYTISGTVSDTNTSWPLYASIDIGAPGYPGASIWTDPELGTYSITLAAGITYTFDVNAWVDGYLSESRDILVTGNATEDFALDADTTTCTAPGYTGSPCTPPADGGLLVGNVYDDNTGDPLNGADVASDGGEVATAVATPDDANVDDAFFTIFSASGSHAFTATLSNYSPDAAAITIVDRDTVRQPFYLPAGVLSVDPDSMHVVMNMGMSATLPMTLTNAGGADVNYELIEANGGYNASPALPETSGGPDSFGYTFLDSNETGGPDFEWIEISGTGQDLGEGDDDYVWPIDLPFVFNFYGTDMSQIAVGSNGTVYFEDDYLGLSNTEIPGSNSYGIDAFIAGYWDDLDPSSGGAVYYETVNYMGTDLAVVEWYQVPNYGTSDPVTYEVILFPNGSILLQYLDPSSEAGSGATVGIQGDTTTGLQYSYDTASLSPDLAICFTYPGSMGCSFAQPIPWLSEVPVTGTVGASASAVISMTFDSGAVSQPGEYYGSLRINNDTPYGSLNFPVTMTVVAPATWGKLDGTVTGLGYCDADPSLLADVAIVITDTSGMTYTTVTDANGYFAYWFDEGDSPLDIAVNAGADYATGSIAGVVITGGVTTTVEFDLRWLQPCVSVDPTAMEVSLAEGYSTTLSLDLANAGAAAAEFTLLEKPGGYTPVNIPAFTGDLPKSNVPTSIGRAPNAPTQPEVGAPALSFPLAGESAFAMNLDSDDLVNIPDTTVPGTWNVVGNIAGNQYFAGDFLNGDFSTLYVLDYGTNSLYTVDTATAVPTLVGASAPNSGQSWTGLTGAVDGTLYASSTDCTTSVLYTIDPNTGAVTPVGSITGASCIIDIAINADGEMYGVDIASDSLYRIDPATGAATSVGSLGVAANYAQGMDFEEESGVLYWAAYTTQGELRIIDTATGASTLVGAFPSGAEVDALAFATGGMSDIPWLSEDPITGTVSADGTYTVDVTFDTMTYTVGTYTGTLRVKVNDPVTNTWEIPVTMHVVSYDVEVAPPTDAITGNVGTVVTYTLTVTNTGTTTDTFDLTASGNTWVSAVTTPVGPLAPGASATAYVAVSIPANAADGSTDTVTITVTSQGDNTKMDTAVLTTTANVPGYFIYLPLILKNP